MIMKNSRRTFPPNTLFHIADPIGFLCVRFKIHSNYDTKQAIWLDDNDPFFHRVFRELAERIYKESPPSQKPPL